MALKTFKMPGISNNRIKFTIILLFLLFAAVLAKASDNLHVYHHTLIYDIACFILGSLVTGIIMGTLWFYKETKNNNQYLHD